MAKTADTIAIYSRKSRYTGKGESIGNQIDLCREYIRAHYGDATAEHAVVFEDEGFSGGNLNRPDFKKMMTAAKERKIRAIVVYRLDRISRNISDFSSLIEELGRLGIDFVSIRESFDTSSPMGRAMMYIASVVQPTGAGDHCRAHPGQHARAGKDRALAGRHYPHGLCFRERQEHHGGRQDQKGL